MSNSNKQPLDTNASSLQAATQGLSKEDCDGLVKELEVCAKRGRDSGEQPSPSICKVSRILRDVSKSPFDPQLVSIGPVHRENEKLKEFEWLKECYLNDLLSRCGSTTKNTLEAYVRKVNDLIDEIKKSYAGMEKNYSNFELAKMMVMDGCFILEFCFKHKKQNEYLPIKMQNSRIAMDLMLLENQVPFVVLQALFGCLAPYVFGSLSQVLDTCLAPYINLFHSPKKNSTTVVDSDSTHDHILGYLHKRHQLADEEQAPKSSNPVHAEASKLVYKELVYTPVHSIVELDRSGMNFKPHQENQWSMTIKFQPSLFPCLPWFGSKPTLLMPTLLIDDSTELILRNFIAYEQSVLQGCYHFTSYAHAVHMLIDTQEDIAKLAESKVLVNIFGSNQEVADMINNICKNIYVTDFYYTDEFIEMDKYYNSFWPTKRRIYFNNPWNLINLLFGIIAFLATVVSAIFAILQYFG